jgi:osmotically inducible protein OsmC
VTRIELATDAQVPGIEEAAFQEMVETTKTTCIISRALAGVPSITVVGTLRG